MTLYPSKAHKDNTINKVNAWSIIGMNVQDAVSGEILDATLEAQLRTLGGAAAKLNWPNVLRDDVVVSGDGKVTQADLTEAIRQHVDSRYVEGHMESLYERVTHIIDDDGKVKVYDTGCFKVIAGAIMKDGKRDLVPSMMQLRCAEHSVTAAWIKTLRQWQYYHLVMNPTSHRGYQPKWRGVDVAVSTTPLLPRKKFEQERKDINALHDMCAGYNPTPETSQVDGCVVKILADCHDDGVAMVLLEQNLEKMHQVRPVIESPSTLQHSGTAVDNTVDRRRAVVQFARALGEARRSEMTQEGDFFAPQYVVEVVTHEKRPADGKDCYLLSFTRAGPVFVSCAAGLNSRTRFTRRAGQQRKACQFLRWRVGCPRFPRVGRSGARHQSSERRIWHFMRSSGWRGMQRCGRSMPFRSQPCTS